MTKSFVSFKSSKESHTCGPLQISHKKKHRKPPLVLSKGELSI